MKDVGLIGLRDYVLQAYTLDKVISIPEIRAILKSEQYYTPLYFNHNTLPVTITKLCDYLLSKGKKPIIIYPERYKKLKAIDIIRLNHHSVLFLVDAKSVHGCFGEYKQSLCKFLIKARIANFIGFAYTKENYERFYNSTIQLISQNCEDSIFEEICINNPRSLSRSLRIPWHKLEQPPEPPKEEGFFQKLLRFLGG